MIDAGSALVKQNLDVRLKKQQTEQLQRSFQNTPSNHPAKQASLIDVGAAAADLLESSNELDNPRIKNDAGHKVESIVGSVALAGQTDPVSALFSLSQIGNAAKENDYPDVSKLVNDKLTLVSQTGCGSAASNETPRNRIGKRATEQTAKRYLIGLAP